MKTLKMVLNNQLWINQVWVDDGELNGIVDDGLCGINDEWWNDDGSDGIDDEGLGEVADERQDGILDDDGLMMTD